MYKLELDGRGWYEAVGSLVQVRRDVEPKESKRAGKEQREADKKHFCWLLTNVNALEEFKRWFVYLTAILLHKGSLRTLFQAPLALADKHKIILGNFR